MLKILEFECLHLEVAEAMFNGEKGFKEVFKDVLFSFLH